MKIHYFSPPASEASREVANLTERKNPHTPVYGVEEFVCLSVTEIYKTEELGFSIFYIT